MKTKHYNWLSINSKLAKISGLKTYNWGIPAYKSASGFKTCPNAAACVAGCYAKAGAYTFSNVAKVFEKRLAFSQSDGFVDGINAEIVRRKVKRVRIHDSGDFYSQAYLNKWIAICWTNPTVQFYAYTKMVKMLKSTLLPDNLTIIYSQGGTQDKLIDVNTDRHNRVFPTFELLTKAGYVDASKDDAVAAAGESNRIGIVYHGQLSYNKTDWQKVK
jgi:hypothetical protein